MYPILAAARAALLQPLEPLIFSSSALTIAAGAATVVVVLCGIAWLRSSSADEDQWYVLVGSLATRPLRLSGRGDGIYVLRVCVKGAELTPVSSLPVPVIVLRWDNPPGPKLLQADLLSRVPCPCDLPLREHVALTRRLAGEGFCPSALIMVDEELLSSVRI